MIGEIRNESKSSPGKGIFIIGACAPIVAILSYMTEGLVIAFGSVPFPANTESWFLLLKRDVILGLIYLNAPDILSIAFLGLMFLALFRAYERDNKNAMAVATFFALLGICTFVAMRSATLSLVALSEKYALASGEAHRSLLIASGDAIGSLGNATPQTAGFFFQAIAAAIISVVMIRSRPLAKATAIFGFAASASTIACDLSAILFSNISGVLIGVSGGFWVTWWILISIGLFRTAILNLDDIP